MTNTRSRFPARHEATRPRNPGTRIYSLGYRARRTCAPCNPTWLRGVRFNERHDRRLPLCNSFRAESKGPQAIRITNTLIAIVTVLGVTGLASTADATAATHFAKHPVGMAALSPSTAALPSTPVDVTLGPGHRGLAVASNPYADNTTVYTTNTGGSHWTGVFGT